MYMTAAYFVVDALKDRERDEEEERIFQWCLTRMTEIL